MRIDHFRRHASPSACLCALALCAFSAAAQPYPSKPIHMIVSSAPGGVTDTSARTVAGEVSLSLGQPIIVDNRGGANGNIGGEACAKASADGYSVCLLNGVAVTFNPFAYARMPFDVERDLAPVVHVGFLDIAVTVHAALPVGSVRERVDYAMARPGRINRGSLGIGSHSHLYMVWLETRTGTQ